MNNGKENRYDKNFNTLFHQNMMQELYSLSTYHFSCFAGELLLRSFWPPQKSHTFSQYLEDNH